jgi:antitoxin component YwqK of YwqJK toxin-antitoxin module
MKTCGIIIFLVLALTVADTTAQNAIGNDGLNGQKKEYYSNGKVSKEYTLENGQPNGVYKTYSEKGLLITEQEFFHGIPHGYYKTFFENGQIQSESNFENGIQNGKSLEYYESGTLKKESYLTGEPWEYSGYTNVFYENGSRMSETKVEKGELVISISYDRKGRVTSEESKGRNISYWYEDNGKKHTTINGVPQD